MFSEGVCGGVCLVRVCLVEVCVWWKCVQMFNGRIHPWGCVHCCMTIASCISLILFCCHLQSYGFPHLMFNNFQSRIARPTIAAICRGKAVYWRVVSG